MGRWVGPKLKVIFRDRATCEDDEEAEYLASLKKKKPKKKDKKAEEGGEAPAGLALFMHTALQNIQTST